MTYRNAPAKLDYYSGTRSYARAVATKEDDTLQTVTNTLPAINAQIMDIQKPSVDLAPIIKELEGLRDDLLDGTNAQSTSGNYIFSGYKVNAKSFQKGRAAMISFIMAVVPLSASRLAKAGIWKLALSAAIFSILKDKIRFSKKRDALIGPLKSDAGNEEAVEWPGEEPKVIMNAARNAVRKTEDNVGNAQVVFGLNLQLLDNLDAVGINQRDGITDQLQRGLGQDAGSQIALVTDLQLSQIAMDSSMMVFQMMQNMSLFNLIK